MAGLPPDKVRRCEPIPGQTLHTLRQNITRAGVRYGYKSQVRTWARMKENAVYAAIRRPGITMSTFRRAVVEAEASKVNDM
jgi:hypothetical protein